MNTSLFRPVIVFDGESMGTELIGLRNAWDEDRTKPHNF